MQDKQRGLGWWCCATADDNPHWPWTDGAVIGKSCNVMGYSVSHFWHSNWSWELKGIGLELSSSVGKWSLEGRGRALMRVGIERSNDT